MSFLFYLAILAFMFLCFLLCSVILMQESKGTGLGASFGGDVSGSVFGTSTADVLRKFTAWLAVAFFAACIILSLWTSAHGRATVRGHSEMTEHLQDS